MNGQFVEFAHLNLKREPWDWRRPFRRRLYVLTYNARRAGCHAWEACVSFHPSMDYALAALPYPLAYEG